MNKTKLTKRIKNTNQGLGLGVKVIVKMKYKQIK